MKLSNIIYKYFFYGLCVLSMALTTASCADNDGPDGEETKPAPLIAERTVLVYMAAHNNLGTDGYDAADLREMSKAAAAGHLGKNRLLVYHAAADGSCTLVEITAKGQSLLKTYADDGLSAVHARRMLDVIADARSYAPSQQFGLILWSHGYGWLQDGIDESGASATGKLKSWGKDGGHTMNITTLASVLENVKPDWVWFDCCYMASVEVAWQLRNATPYIVGSCIELPANGMPYDETLKYLMREKQADLVAAAASTFSHYNALTDPEARTCTMSVIETDKLDELMQATLQVYAHATDIYPAGYRPQKFMTSMKCWYFDLADYVYALCEQQDDGNGQQRKAAWNVALSHVVKFAEATPSIWDRVDIKSHCGLSTYIFETPAQATAKNYMDLDWPQQVWPDMR